MQSINEFPEKSKNFKLSLERSDLTNNKLGFNTTWGRGLSIHPSHDHIIFALANLEMAVNSSMTNTIAAGYSAEVGLNKNLYDKSRLLFTFNNKWFPNENYKSKTLYLGLNYYLNHATNISFELNFEKNTIRSENTSSIRINYLF